MSEAVLWRALGRVLLVSAVLLVAAAVKNAALGHGAYATGSAVCAATNWRAGWRVPREGLTPSIARLAVFGFAVAMVTTLLWPGTGLV